LDHETEVAKARLKVGDISDSDEKQIEINGAEFDLQAKSAAAAAAQARIAVEILMGNPEPKGDWQPVDSLSEMAETVQSIGPTGTNALRPDVLAADADLRQSRSDLKLQKAMRIPDPTFLAGEEHNPPPGGPPVDTVIVGVSFPLPLWNQNQGEIRAQQAVVDQNVLALEKARAQAASDLANARVEYDEAFGRWQRYHSEIIPNSAKSRDAVAFAYEKGEASWVDLLEAERADNDARLAEAQARADTASAIADMNAAEMAVTEGELNSQK
jgi:cobalt-zinc-cadmium efflux system outer membrane protein